MAFVFLSKHPIRSFSLASAVLHLNTSKHRSPPHSSQAKPDIFGGRGHQAVSVTGQQPSITSPSDTPPVWGAEASAAAWPRPGLPGAAVLCGTSCCGRRPGPSWRAARPEVEGGPARPSAETGAPAGSRRLRLGSAGRAVVHGGRQCECLGARRASFPAASRPTPRKLWGG